MASNGKFQPGQSGNPATHFKPGDRHRWQPGQSGNPAGIPRSRLKFEESFNQALLGRASADEPANLLWEAVRKRERWAIQELRQRLAREAKQVANAPGRRNAAGVKLANAPVVRPPGAADADANSRARDPLPTQAVASPTRAHNAEAESSGRVSLKQRYEEFCMARVKDYLKALPQAIRAQRFEETRSAIRRAVPQLRRDERDVMAQRDLESKIRAGLHLPSIEEFTAGSVQ